MSNALCTNADILAANNTAEFLEKNCEGETEIIPFLSLYYVDMPEEYRLPILIVFGIIFMFVIFNFLGTTADAYLAPSLETLSSRLELSEAVAGVTLVALVNGVAAGISGIVAGGKKEGGPEIAIGGVFGACFFTITFVLFACIWGAGTIRVNAHDFNRDLIFFIISLLYFIGLTFVGTIEVTSAAIFFLLYVVYFVYVALQERKKSKIFKEKQRRFNRFVKALIGKKNRKQQMGMWDSMLGSYMIKRMAIERRRANISIKPQDFKFELNEYDYDDDEYDEKDELRDVTLSKTSPEEQEGHHHKHKRGCWDTFMFLYNYPLFVVRDFTMPAFEEEQWSFWKTLPTPACGLLFLAHSFGAPFDNMYFWIAYGSVSLIFTLIIAVTGRKKNLIPAAGGIFAVFTLIVSILWIDLGVSIFLDFLSLVQVTSGIPLTYLSLTILGWGNSLDNLLVDFIISKNGHGSMAVTGVFSGQIFTLLVGYGGAVLRYSLSFKPVELDIYGGGFSALLTCILVYSILVCAILTLIVAKCSDYKLGSGMKIFVTVYYILFFIAATVLCVGNMAGFITF